MAKKKDGWLLTGWTAAALAAGVLWTLVTGQVWQWLAILGAIGVALWAAKAAHRKDGGRPQGRRQRRR